MKETEHKKSESAYKEFEGKHLNSPYNCPFDNKPCFKSNCVHSDEYPALCGNKDEKMKPVSAPSESQEDQEELWKEARHYIDVWRIEELFKRFKITRKPE